jgi:hypothetical protein
MTAVVAGVAGVVSYLRGQKLVLDPPSREHPRNHRNTRSEARA